MVVWCFLLQQTSHQCFWLPSQHGQSFSRHLSGSSMLSAVFRRHRLMIRATFGRSSERKQGEKMLLLLVESNVLYCSTLVGLILCSPGNCPLWVYQMIPFACLFIWPGLGDFDGGTYLWPMTTHISASNFDLEISKELTGYPWSGYLSHTPPPPRHIREHIMGFSGWHNSQPFIVRPI